nr:hypothetical protein B0A51_11431 [Rachicladosporium sp. CCFEE 5018]
MSTKGGLPDAWDDDWENLADKPEISDPAPEPAKKLTKAQKRVQHQELQKQLWDSAENPARNLWLEAQGAVPLKQEPVIQRVVLTRKPATAAQEDEDSEGEKRRKAELALEERKRKAVTDREEKVRKYAEARERIMGTGAASGPASRDSSQGRDTRKSHVKATNSNLNSRPTSAGQSPARSTPNGSGLFDPEDMGRRLAPKRETTSSPREGEPARQPRGPDTNGRGGFGFASRDTMAMGGILGVMFLAFASVILLATTIATDMSTVPCNRWPDNCGRKYSNISFIGTHDSAFVGSIYDPRVNQEKTVTQQLDAGIRFLQAQTHQNAAGTPSMCHTSCTELDAGSLAKYLREVRTWLEGNPNDVVTLLLLNGDDLDLSVFDAIFGRSRMRDYAFVPASSPRTLAISDWPTLSALIQLNKRLIVFLDSKADTTKVPYILPEFDYFFETPYDTTDPAFKQCTLDRPAGSSPEGKMYIVNHFLDKTALWTSVLAALCEKLYGRRPNVVLVDMIKIRILRAG